MKRYKTLILVLSGVAGLIFSDRALAETPFVDPLIPDGEKAVYASQVGDTKFTVENTDNSRKGTLLCSRNQSAAGIRDCRKTTNSK